MILQKSSLRLLTMTVFASAAWLAAAPDARAGEADEALDHFEKGVTLYNEGSWEPALDEFRASHALQPHWKIRINIANCLIKLKRHGEAMTEIVLTKEEGGQDMDGKLRDQVDKIIESLSAKVARIRLDAAIGGKTALYVDGKIVPSATKDGLVYVDPGTHEVLVTHGKNKIAMTMIDLKQAGDEVAIDIAGKIHDATPAASAGPVPLSKRWALWTGIATLAAGAAFMGAFGGLYVEVGDYNDDLEEARMHVSGDVCSCFDEPLGSSCYASGYVPSLDYRDRVREICGKKHVAATANAMLALGVIFTLTGVGLLVYDGVKAGRLNKAQASSQEKSAWNRLSLSLTPSVGPGVAWLALGGHF
jgi:hypothetical protein